ncbi:MAG TPA: hypothetical protein VHZ52_05680 [Acidobacteriaceae bacterium]|jgi:hypothetical protein|nr:hypothetical protein [Acidobacteriaceae bacterium]
MQMKPKSELDEVFAELREEHRTVKAPAGLESLLSAEAERRARVVGNAGRNRVWAWGLSAALLALVLLGAAEWRMHRAGIVNEARTLGAQPHPEPHAGPTQETLPKNVSAKVPELEHRAEQTSVRHSHGPAVDRQADSQEVSLADFIPLPASEGLPQAYALSLVRMRIEQSSLQQYGLEVPAENASRILLAEFAVGEDGLPRAIRIIP